MKWNKALTLVMAGTLAMTALSGCGNNSGSGSTSTSSKSTDSKSTSSASSTGSSTSATPTNTGGAPTYPLVDPGSASIKIFTPDNYYAPKSYKDNLPIYQEFEKLTGVKVEWEVLPGNEYNTTLQTRLAAAMNLPDLMVPWGVNVAKMGEDGLFLPLNDLIKENGYYLNSLFGMYDTVRKAITMPDGNIYAYPGFGEGIITDENDMRTGVWNDPGANINLHVPAIRKDWLDKLGLKMPETLDDWYTVLKAFKTQDPNGNGKADEIPLSPSWGLSNLFRFGDAFGLYLTGNADSEFDVGSDGKLFYKYTDPRFKQTLEFLNKLYSEGLIDAEYASATFDYSVQKINQNLVGAIPSEWMSNPPSWQANLRASGVAEAEWAYVRPPKNPEGVSVTHNRWSIWNQTVITKDCKDPALALKWMDVHCLSPEGILLQMYGVEGVSYEVKDGKPTYNDFVLKNPDGIGPFEAIRSIGGWCTGLPYIQTKSAYENIYADNEAAISFSANFKGDELRTAFPSLNLTREESEVTNEIKANINTYKGEMINKFIEGKEPLDKFDAYVKEIEKLGLSAYLEAYQTAYDRYQNS